MKSFLLKLMIPIFSLNQALWASVYVVHPGDTLSGIARNQISEKVYGNEGSLKRLLSLNPQITNPDLIFPGQSLYLEPKKPLVSDRPTPLETKPSIAEEARSPAENQIEAEVQFRVTPEYSLLTLAATDTNTQSQSTVASKYFLRLKSSYEQIWSKAFQSAVYLKLAIIEFEEPTNSTRTLTDKGKFLSSVGFETRYLVTKQLSLYGHVEFGKELFVRAETSTSDAVDAINLASVGAKINYAIVQRDPFVLGLGGSYTIKLPARADAYSVKQGQEYAAYLYLDQLKGGQSQFFTELGLRYRKQDTTATTQDESNIFLAVTIPLASQKATRRSH